MAPQRRVARSTITRVQKKDVAKPQHRRSTVNLDFGTEVFTVFVYQSKDDSKPDKRHTIHTKLACTASPFFATALKRLGGGQAKEVKLHKTTSFALECFIQWLYTDSIDRYLSAVASTSEEKLDDHLIHSHLLGDMLTCRDFQDCLMDAYLDACIQFKWQLSARYVSMVWQQTGKCSPLRKLYLDIIVGGRGHLFVRGDEAKHLTLPFLIEAWTQMEQEAQIAHATGTSIQAKRFITTDTRLDRCKYHVHTVQGKPCYKTLK